MAASSAALVSGQRAAKVQFRFWRLRCLRMTGLPTFAAVPRVPRRKCKRMLRQQHGKTSMSEMSHEQPHLTQWTWRKSPSQSSQPCFWLSRRGETDLEKVSPYTSDQRFHLI